MLLSVVYKSFVVLSLSRRLCSTVGPTSVGSNRVEASMPTGDCAPPCLTQRSFVQSGQDNVTSGTFQTAARKLCVTRRLGSH